MESSKRNMWWVSLVIGESSNTLCFDCSTRGANDFPPKARDLQQMTQMYTPNTMLALATRSSRCNKHLRRTIFFVTSFNIVCSPILIIKHNQSLEGVPGGPLNMNAQPARFQRCSDWLFGMKGV